MRVKKMLLCSVMALSLVTLAACGMGDNADDNGNTDGTNVESTTGAKTTAIIQKTTETVLWMMPQMP